MYMCGFFDHTDAALDEPFVSPAKSNKSRLEKNLGQMSPVIEPFGVVPHILYIFHSSQLPPAILKRKNTAFFCMRGKQTFCPSHTGNITERSVASPVCNLQMPQPKADTSEQLGGTDTYRGPYKSENSLINVTLMSVYMCVSQQSSFIHSILNGTPHALRLCLTYIFAAMHN
ncbi:hypothetical protein fugu_001133 [Takifugu bimaculatus]|uniref:Uncharacterized protein n=1 Tax=Takifugu bimaculatus TaxID=433685 RepID=A0A4Z2CJ32_9TELE|nr:hypothetical protein fugu_001133 [Takifugu bimaculatus]